MKTICQFNQLKEELNLSIIPNMATAKLIIQPSNRLLTLEQVRQILDQFSPDFGWVLYRDELSTDAVDFSRNDIIEGEWGKPKHSLRLRQVSPNQYRLTECHEAEGDTDAYQDITVKLQPITTKSHATYRVWWRCETTGPRKGRWEPYYQQLIGFDLGE